MKPGNKLWKYTEVPQVTRIQVQNDKLTLLKKQWKFNEVFKIKIKLEKKVPWNRKKRYQIAKFDEKRKAVAPRSKSIKSHLFS